MKSPSTPRHMHQSFAVVSRGLAALSLAGTLVMGASQAHAADGTWNLNGSDTWSTANTTPWLNSIVASGIDSSAYFNALNITSDATVTLSENLAIGNLYFGDTSGAQTWTLARSSTFVLTLQRSSGSPTITVDNSTATISAVLAGTEGFTKAGSGRLVLSGSNTLTGGIIVNAGTLDIRSTSSVGSNSINLATSGSVLDAANPVTGSVTISGNITGSGKINKTSSVSALVLTGDNSFTGGGDFGRGLDRSRKRPEQQHRHRYPDAIRRSLSLDG